MTKIIQTIKKATIYSKYYKSLTSIIFYICSENSYTVKDIAPFFFNQTAYGTILNYFEMILLYILPYLSYF